MTDDQTPDAASDAIARLRAADPVPRPVSHPSDPPVRATLEEILMTSTETPTETPTPTAIPSGTTDPGTTRPDPWYRRPGILAAAAALLIVAGVIGAIAEDDGDGTVDTGGETAALPTAPEGTGDAAAGDLFPDGEPTDGVLPPPPGSDTGTEVTSCVEMYSAETLANREYAFDGTVTTVEGSDMAFAVNEWFRGADRFAGDTVTLDHQGYLGMLFAPDGPALEPGTRVLVAGDGGFVWSCGFTQLHDPAVADEWRAATAG